MHVVPEPLLPRFMACNKIMSLKCVAAAPKLDEIPCFDTTCGMEIVTAIINSAASIPAPRKRIRLRPVVQVTAISDAESSDHDRDIAARHIVPDDLLHVVDSI